MKISNKSSNEEKAEYLNTVVFENIDTLPSGRLTIKKKFLTKVFEILGGDYNKLSKVGKFLFRSELLSERIWFDTDISKYYNY